MALDVSTQIPDDDAAAAVRRLADDLEGADGSPPLSDQARSRISAGGPEHVVVRDDGRVVGYAQRDGESLEVVGRPEAVATLLDAAVQPGLRVWSHGRRSPLVAEFEARGFERARELHQLRRPLDADHPLGHPPPLADGITVRTFQPGADDDAWLAVNAAAFASHPEQGGWTRDDLHSRMAEDWFDARDFLLADREGTLLGFHWTKIHSDGAGEVYVLGVSPDAQGLGLGSALLVRGLAHLADRGCQLVLLYVDGDNPNALHLYERSGFARYDLDVQWVTRVS